MNNSRLETKPSITHLYEIHDWLKEEYLTKHKGFYSNWRKIKEAFEEGELLIYEVNKVVVGFIVFTEIDSTRIIDIAAIKPSERGKGIGREFVNRVVYHFNLVGVKTLKIFCSPPSSESFWRKCGFDSSDDSLIELGMPLTLKINANLNVNPSLTSVTFP